MRIQHNNPNINTKIKNKEYNIAITHTNENIQNNIWWKYEIINENT